ncbi:MAG: AzlC family ABC transporter permease [Alphaproteobacteria bacterium]|nr:AzlC family ABC transporter permease [Alphaproteobacteria bacterium]
MSGMPPSAATPGAAERPCFTADGLRRGLAGSLPMVVTAIVYGLVFGVLAESRGLSLLDATLMSTLVFSGSAQVAAVEAGTQSQALAPMLLAAAIVNARYVLLGATLRPWLAGHPPLRGYACLFMMSDANWPLAMREHLAGRRDAAILVGSGLSMYLPWIAATGVGHAFGALVGNPAALGLDLLLVAFCAAMVVGFWRSRADVLPAVAAAAAALLADRLLPGSWYIAAGGLAGALAGGLARSGNAGRAPDGGADAGGS